MKPYGIPRRPEIEYPDIGDIQQYALKGSVGRLPAPVYKSYIRNAKVRRATRRYFKKRERQQNKINLLDAMQ